MILSQILRGVADVTATAAARAGGQLAHIEAAVLGAALQRGVELVIASMGGEEIPGTIVSVLRAAATAVAQCARAGEGVTAAVIAAGDAAVIALEKTPEQLDVLADAGAVDAGGRGLLVLLDALRTTITGQAPARTVYRLAPRTAAPEAAAPRPAPQFEVMYRLDDCAPAAPTRCATGSPSWAIRSASPRRRRRPSTPIRCTCIPTMPAPPWKPGWRPDGSAAS